MDELYGLHYSLQEENFMVGDYCHHQHHQQQHISSSSSSPVVTAFNHVGGVDNPLYGSEQFGSGSSGISDAASTVVAELHRNNNNSNANTNANANNSSEDEVSSAIRTKIASHPLYPKLLQTYIDCQKVGVPPETVDFLDEIRRENDVHKRTVVSSFGTDPELDEFMETYCDILGKFKSDLEKPFDEATSFLNSMETQLNNLCNGVSRSCGSDEGGGSSEEELLSGGETDGQDGSRAHVDRELKDKLIRKYGAYISSLKQEFSKKKKKGKLPKQARQALFDWWNLHYKWPYPTEADKIALAESTGLDQKQINNWFINQRKRHWKPSENMQLGVLESLYGSFS